MENCCKRQKVDEAGGMVKVNGSLSDKGIEVEGKMEKEKASENEWRIVKGKEVVKRSRR